jgi:putative membrane-bound dehydrogenase-like protein
MKCSARSSGLVLFVLAVGLVGLLGCFLLDVNAARGQGKADEKHDPARAVANLDIHPDLAATLFASEPVLTNPTNIDIDSRGRVWVCDVVNYRGNNGKRPAGDRILILEDTDGDGKMDKVKTFYQGRDVDSAMGICVLGNKVIVSCSPNVLVFTFDADDKIVKKEYLFTKTGQPQHDHSAHTFVFGPDGRLYWNFGNTGQAVHDKEGKPVIDRTGNKVVDNGKPYFGGMVFRCDPDGGNFEVLAHNFRNNYEVAVDSFGTLWQSDNDDDGNRGVRINYVMEYGNYGYRDEMTGAFWNSPRTNLEPEIPRRHWHLNDPGVVPNLLQTGQGSPCGICVYEGTLLPKAFQRQIIHCDAGPSIVRAYPAKKDGAGYSATIIDILDGSRKNNWFRPVDPRIAPDGSLFVSDWYDPGVGGHAQRDLDRGRIFRVAPPGSRYQVPKFDFTTIAGAAKALENPCSSVRYLAWTALHQKGKEAEPKLLELWASRNPVSRARALWLLGRIEGRGQHYVSLALKDPDPDLRVTGVRLGRQLALDPIGLVESVLKDPAPEVRRECAIALRHVKSPRAAELWAELALQHDGRDRWYLESLGIGADGQWDEFFGAWLKKAGDRATTTAAGRNIVWRSRAAKTPEYLARIIQDSATSTAELPRYFRAFDFLQGPEKGAALTSLVISEPSGDVARQTFVLLESLRRLEAADVRKQPRLATALERVVGRKRGTSTFVEIVGQFGLEKYYPDLLSIAQKNPDQQLGVNAVKVLLENKQQALFQKALDSKDAKLVQATLQALTTTADDRVAAMLLELAQDPKRELELRRQAIRIVARTRGGANSLIRLASAGKMAKELESAAGAALVLAPWKEVKSEVGKLFPLPPSKEGKPLPAFSELLKIKGNAVRGREVFKNAGTCATCHVVNGEGKDVGPNLSEIGKKLSREALLESILYPSAAISHGYETWVVNTNAGRVETGILTSNTAEGITLKGADSLLRSIKKADIESLEKSPTSLMPADLHKALTPQDLADLLDYLLTLKEPPKVKPTGK